MRFFRLTNPALALACILLGSSASCRSAAPSPNRNEGGFAFYLGEGWEAVHDKEAVILSPSKAAPGAPKVTLRLIPQRDALSEENKVGFERSLKRMKAELLVSDHYALEVGARRIERTEWIYLDKDQNRLSQWLALVDEGPRRIELSLSSLGSELELYREDVETLLRSLHYATP